MPNSEVARLRWVKLYEQLGDAGKVCRRCGISRPTLRKWIRRYAADGAKGLESRSTRPLHSPTKKVTARDERLILGLRKERKLGARRLQSELRRQHDRAFALATIHKVLVRGGAAPLKPLRRRRDGFKRYSRPIPGDRVQLDTCKIAPGLYQYTAIDDCTRMRVLGLYRRRTGSNTLRFLERLVEELPFPIQRIQTDRGAEFFALPVQERLRELCIKFRPTPPRSPHLNGKVERSQKTDLAEFYPTANLRGRDLHLRLDEWQHYYNWDRPHSSLKGKTPMERCCELLAETPLGEDVERAFDESKEPIRVRDFRAESMLRKLKRGP